MGRIRIEHARTRNPSYLLVGCCFAREYLAFKLGNSFPFQEWREGEAFGDILPAALKEVTQGHELSSASEISC